VTVTGPVKMYQEADMPLALHDLVARVVYRPGWKVKLAVLDRGQGSSGLTLVITTRGYDSYHPERGENYGVHHYFIVPAAGYDERSWRRWLFEQYLLVERHEAMEFFALEDEPGTGRVTRPYAPSHGPGNDPYLIREVGTETDQRTSFRGVLDG
jgi:hypothetical protein